MSGKNLQIPYGVCDFKTLRTRRARPVMEGMPEGK